MTFPNTVLGECSRTRHHGFVHLRILFVALLLLSPAALAVETCYSGACAGTYHDVRGAGSCGAGDPYYYEENGASASYDDASVAAYSDCSRFDDETHGHSGYRELVVNAETNDVAARVTWWSSHNGNDSCFIDVFGPASATAPCPADPPLLPALP